MKPDDFNFISTFIKQRSGLALTSDKVYLLESRLLPIARQHGLESLDNLLSKLRAAPDNVLVKEVIEAMTTNESSFFRDSKPFDQLRHVVLPRLQEMCGMRREVRIWSAASSTGQEAYSIAMCLQEEAARLNGWNFEIIGTDIADKVLERAREAIYTQFEVQRGLPIQMLVKYFTQLKGEDNRWQVNEKTRAMVTYRQLNLLDDYSSMGKFDIIFCRNVLIYFDEATKSKVLEKLCNALNPQGVLYLGASETILGLTNKFKPMENERGIYLVAA